MIAEIRSYILSQMTFSLPSTSCLLKLLKPGFHIIAPVATVVAVVEKRVLTQKYFLSDASDTVSPYYRRCRSISLKLGRGDLGSITNF